MNKKIINKKTMNKEKDIIKLLEAMLELFTSSIKKQGVKQTYGDKGYIAGVEDSINAIKEYNKL